jgi:glycosyltransferase involved in cell wall biosynthesis
MEAPDRVAPFSVPGDLEPSDIDGSRGSLDILIVTSEAPPIVSGISTCIDRLEKGLVGRGHNVTVLSSVQIPRLTLGEWRLSSFATHWRRVARALGNFDVVNVHGPIPTMSDVFLREVTRLPSYARPPVVYTYHSPIDIKSASRLSAHYNRYHRKLALRADRIVASSQYYANAHWTRFGPPVRAIPWGVDLPVPGQSTLPGEPTGVTDKLRVLFVGQMRQYKGVETLLAAVAGQDWLELTLVGRGPELDKYQRLAKRLAATNVRFTGRLPDPELSAQYQANDVIVLPSVTRAEAFGLVLLEGMASGCVPVASDLPGVRDVAGPTGLVVRPGDAEALRGALWQLASEPERLDQLKHASLRAAQALSWDNCVTSYEQLFLDAVRGRYARLHGLAVLPGSDEDPHLLTGRPAALQLTAGADKVQPNVTLPVAK